jgi:hypothetical protein
MLGSRSVSNKYSSACLLRLCMSFDSDTARNSFITRSFHIGIFIISTDSACGIFCIELAALKQISVEPGVLVIPKTSQLK